MLGTNTLRWDIYIIYDTKSTSHQPVSSAFYLFLFVNDLQHKIHEETNLDFVIY